MVDVFKFTHEFFDFEVKNKLFDIKDNRGNYIWDIFRTEVFSACAYPPENINHAVSLQFSKFFYSIKSMFYTLFPTKRYNFFFMQSRDNLDGKLFDRNSYDIYCLLNPKDCFLYETYFSKKKKIYKQAEGTLMLRGLMFKMFSKFVKVDTEVAIKIYELLKNNFENFNLTEEYFFNLYKGFYFDLWFYTKLFKFHGAKRIFFEGEYKGVCCAAKKLNLTLIEVQHGTLTFASTSYSYPKYPDLETKTYRSKLITAMSDFWFSECYMPMQKIILGNNFFSQTVTKKDAEFILVISNHIIGTDMTRLIKEVAFESGEKFIFKLHPTEYTNVQFYKNEFRNFENVDVYTNETDLHELLSHTKKMLTAGSTCVYESLQSGIPVILYELHNFHYQHKNVFNHQGIRLCDSAEKLKSLLKQDWQFEPTIFFQPFDKEKALKMLCEN